MDTSMKTIATQTTQAELIVDARCAIGESPVWMVAEQALYWVDISARLLYRWQASNGVVSRWLAPEMIGCVAPRVAEAGGGWVAAMETGVFLLKPGASDETMQCELLAEVKHASSDMRFNDGRCDRQGRLRAGTMFLDTNAGRKVGVLYGYEKKSGLKPLVEDLIVSNGLAFSPDGRTMYLSDSHASVQQIWAFDYDLDTGTPHHRRLFVDMNLYPGRPDGGAVDEDGCYWICGNDAGQIHRFTPQGKLDRSLTVPVKKPSMCAFGGAGMDTLFVASIRPDGIGLGDQPLAGGVFALRPGVRGLPEPMFTD